MHPVVAALCCDETGGIQQREVRTSHTQSTLAGSGFEPALLRLEGWGTFDERRLGIIGTTHMKAHIGIERRSKLIHSVEATLVNVYNSLGIPTSISLHSCRQICRFPT